MMKSESMKISVRGRRPTGIVSGKEALLPVATRHFSHYGYAGTSLRKIAAEAKVDMALIARIFGAKAQLWNAVLEELLIKQRHHLTKLREINATFADNPYEGIRHFIRHLILISTDIPEFPALLLNEAAGGEERLEHLLELIVKPFRNSCLPIINQAIMHNVLKGKNSHIIFALLISAISLPITTPQIIKNDTQLTPAFLEELTEEIILLIAVA